MAPLDRLRRWARVLKLEVVALWLAARDPLTPLGAKLVAGIVAAYAFSPIDLIPDFIPVLGYLDDLLLIPAGIWLALRLIPPDRLTAARAAAALVVDRPVSRRAAIVIATIWIAGAAFFGIMML
jgi:uncharacterized membrane protein YkvA (DUF1232 family)